MFFDREMSLELAYAGDGANDFVIAGMVASLCPRWWASNEKIHWTLEKSPEDSSLIEEERRNKKR